MDCIHESKTCIGIFVFPSDLLVSAQGDPAQELTDLERRLQESLLGGERPGAETPNPPKQNVEIESVNIELQNVMNGQTSPEIYRVNGNEDPIKRLLKQQINLLYGEFNDRRRRMETGSDDPDAMYETLLELLSVRLEFHEKPTEQKIVLDEQLKIALELEKFHSDRLTMGVGRRSEAYRASFVRAKIELALERFKISEETKSKQLNSKPAVPDILPSNSR